MDLNDLSVYVQHVNSRKEKHGDRDVLAVDVALRLMIGAQKVIAKLDDDAEESEHEIETGNSWDGLLLELMGNEEAIADFVDHWCSVCSQIIFAKEHEQHRAVFQYAPDTASLVTLTHASINKYKVDCDDLGITFRVQASEVDGDTVGSLAELIGMTVRLSLSAEQLPLKLEPQSDAVPPT